mmetsp:Transcript_16818/g.34674  ORF Transcript_16818/g.34674 Transcript_16818/m.34674 type:complete len:101 (-) Transcript_16818:40-342(-)
MFLLEEWNESVRSNVPSGVADVSLWMVKRESRTRASLEKQQNEKSFMSVERDRAGCVSLLRILSRFWVSITKRMSWSPTRCESRLNFPSRKKNVYTIIHS